MHTLASLAKQIGRSPSELQKTMKRFEVPLVAGAGYSDAHLAFLRVVFHLRTLRVQDDLLLRLWEVEKKLLQLLHLDAGGSPTWFLDACGRRGRGRGRLLLTQREIGVDLGSDLLQPGLDFSPEESGELFPGEAMGEDAVKMLGEYRKLFAKVRSRVEESLPEVRAAAAWGRRSFS